MLSFSSGWFGTFRCDADLTRSNHATVRFYDALQNDILFALTIDPVDRVARFNQKVNGAWQTERLVPAANAPGVLSISVVFRPFWITVSLNGTKLRRIFRGYPGRAKIRFVQFSGGVLQESARIGRAPTGPYVGKPRIGYVGPIDFRIEGAVHHRNAETLTFHVPGLVSQPYPLPDLQRQFDTGQRELGMSVRLPGRVWMSEQTQHDGVSVQLVSSDGRQHAAFVLTRRRILSEIDRKLPYMLQERAASDVVPLLEHVRYARLLPDLSPDAQDAARRLADQLGLRAFLEPAGQVATPPKADRPLLARITYEKWGRMNPGYDPAEGVRNVIADMQLDHLQTRAFLTQLAGEFCLRGRADDLADILRDGNQPLVWDVANNDWSRSTALPFRLIAGDLQGGADLLHHMKRDDAGGWVETACVAYFIRTVLENHTSHDAEHIGRVIHEFAGYLQREAAPQWGRISCLQLTTAAAAVIEAQGVLPPDIIDAARPMLLRACALQPSFWAALRDRTKPQNLNDPLLDQFRRLFEHLEEARHDEDRDEERSALQGLCSLGAYGTERLLRAQDIWQHEYSDNLTDGAVRAAAASGFLQKGGTVAADLLQKKLHEMYNSSSKSPHYPLQLECSRQILEVLKASAAGHRKLMVPSPLLEKLQCLAPIESRSLGLTLLLTMFTELLRSGHLAAAEQSVSVLPGFLAPENGTGVPELDWRYGTLRGCQYAEPGVVNALCKLENVSATLSGEALRLARSALATFPSISRNDSPQCTDEKLSPEARLFDTIVVVTSCRANLSSQVSALRRSWLKSLRDMGIPYVIFVGSGETHGGLPQDVVCLDVPDDYEGLPQKTLAAIKWVYENTTHSYLLKVDDDCFLNAELYFHSQSYRKFDYYGRILGSVSGIFDRGWHCRKSSTDRARHQLDASSAFLSYADGGSGYSLSRRAMSGVLNAVRGYGGHEILSRSFLEDKIIGELLETQGIYPADEDYTVLIKRRNNPRGTAVPAWVNGFEAGRSSPTKLIHMDSPKGHAAALKNLTSDRLHPMMIWPTESPAVLGTDTNALTLVSSEQTLRTVADLPVVVISCMRNEKFMLRHFLSHYRAMGVDGFIVADNGSDDGTLEILEREPDVAVFSAETEYRKSNYGVIWQQMLLGHFRRGKWSVVADADEFLVYRGWPERALPDHLVQIQNRGINAVRVRMLDMYPNGETDAAHFSDNTPFDGAPFADRVPWVHLPWSRGPFSSDETFTSALRHRMIPESRPESFVAQKIAVLNYRPEMQPSAGFHYMANARTATEEMIFAHFKYTAEYRTKAEEEVRRGQHFNNAEEYRQYLRQIRSGGAPPFDQKHSAHWQDIPEVRRILHLDDELPKAGVKSDAKAW